MTPTARSLATLRDAGWTAGVVERRLGAPGRPSFLRDLFGCIDIVAAHPDRGILGVQATSDGGTRGSDVARRVAKSLAEPRLRTWLQAGAAFEVWGWGKRGARGERKLWTLRRNAIRIVGGELVVMEPES